MKIRNTLLEGVIIVDNFQSEDDRGLFTKTYNKTGFVESGIEFHIKESYYSISKKDVIRGMHFQLPPDDHEKLVFVPQGSILDVIIDLRRTSSTFKEFITLELSSSNRSSVFIPKGMAHGFKALEDSTITVYNVATEYNQKSDYGIRFDSFGFEWDLNNPIISTRDANFKSLDDFLEINPF